METSHNRILLVLVGLPARGKSTVAYKLQAFLRWRGQLCETFNVGSTRRKQVKDIPQDASFFSSTNPQATATREQLAMMVLNEALDFLDHQNGDVAILDATNTTRRRRRTILEKVAERYRTVTSTTGSSTDGNRNAPPSPPSRNSRHRYPPSVLFVESICTDPHVLESNMLQKVLNSPDYCSMPIAVALNDLRHRIAEYEKVYEPVDDVEDTNSPLGSISYIKLIDLQSKVICRNISGALMFTVVSYLMVLHIGSRPIWLVRAGQCTDDAIRAMLRKTHTPSNSSTGTSSDRNTVTAPTTITTHTVSATPSSDLSSSSLIASAQSTGIYQVVSALNSSLASSALSAGLSLNENGIAFRNMLSNFILRRVAGGRYAVASNVNGNHSFVTNGNNPHPTPSLTGNRLSLSSKSLKSLPIPPSDTLPVPPNDGSSETVTTNTGNNATNTITVKRLTQVDNIRPLRISMSSRNLLSSSSTMMDNYDTKITNSDGNDTASRSVLPSMRIIIPPPPSSSYISSSSDLMENSLHSPIANHGNQTPNNRPTSMVKVRRVGHVTDGSGSNSGRNTPGGGTSRSRAQTLDNTITSSGSIVNSSRTATPMLTGATDPSLPSLPSSSTLPSTDNSSSSSSSLSSSAVTTVMDNLALPSNPSMDSYSNSTSNSTAPSSTNEEYLEPDDGVIVEQINIPGHYHDSKDIQSTAHTVGPIETIDIFDDEPVIFCSTLPRTTQTADGLSPYFPTEPTTALNPMSTGIAMGVPLQHLREQFPEEWERFQNAPDRTRHRVTGGESLMDVVTRLQPLLMDVERIRRPVLLISHLSTLQVLYAYFKSLPLAECVNIAIPMNCLIEFTPHQYGWIEKRYTFTKATTEETITSSFK